MDAKRGEQYVLKLLKRLSFKSLFFSVLENTLLEDGFLVYYQTLAAFKSAPPPKIGIQTPQIQIL